MPTVRDIVAAHLRNWGFDGLCSCIDSDDGYCHCTLDDLMPCTDGRNMWVDCATCVPGRASDDEWRPIVAVGVTEKGQCAEALRDAVIEAAKERDAAIKEHLRLCAMGGLSDSENRYSSTVLCRIAKASESLEAAVARLREADGK